jgi:hypothetical protein
VASLIITAVKYWISQETGRVQPKLTGRFQNGVIYNASPPRKQSSQTICLANASFRHKFDKYSVIALIWGIAQLMFEDDS